MPIIIMVEELHHMWDHRISAKGKDTYVCPTHLNNYLGRVWICCSGVRTFIVSEY